MYKFIQYGKKLLPLVAYACVVLVAFGGALFPKEHQILFAPDIWRYHYYQKPFLWTQLLHGVIPFWNPYIFSGQPYLEHPQVTAWYPINIVYLFLPIAYAISWSLAIHIFLGTAGMFWFAKRFVNTIPAWVAGLAFGLSSYFFGRIYAGHLEIIAASIWIPYVVAAFWYLFKKQNKFNTVRAGLLFALQLFAGHQPVALYTLEAIGLLWVCLSVRHMSVRSIGAFLLAIGLGLGITAVQLLPNQQFLSHSIRSLELPADWANIAVPKLSNIFELLDPHLFYELLPKIPLGHEHASYIGKLPLLFALVAVFWAIRHKSKKAEIWWLVMLCIFSWWVSLGNNVSLDLFSVVRQYVPFYKELRIPSRHLILFVFAASMLAAFGIEKIKNKKVQYCIVLLVLLDLVPLFRHDVHLGEVPEIKQDQSLVAFLQKDTSLHRFLPDYYHGDLLRENFEFDTPMNYGIYSSSGYDQPPLRNYYEFLMAIHNVTISDIVPYIETVPPFQNMSSPYINFLNIKYIFIPVHNDPPLSALSSRYKLIADKTDRGYKLYENTAVLPRFYMVPGATVYKSQQDLLSALRLARTDPTETVLLVGSPVPMQATCRQNDLKSIDVISYTATSITLHSKNMCNGYLVSSEVMYPGWTATIDGASGQLLTGNGAFRTLFVPKGEHTVVLRYVPKLYFIFFGISFILAVGSLFVLLKTASLKT